MSDSHISTATAASQLAPDNGEIEIDLTPSTGKVPEVPDGVYPLTLKEIGRAPSQYGGQVPVLKFTIDGREEDGTPNMFVSKARWNDQEVRESLTPAHTHYLSGTTLAI
jgi:hypothetical protein